MRKIIMFNHVSPDGAFAAPDGGLDWTVPDPRLEADSVHGMSGPGAMLFGRKTYEMFEAFWPKALDGASTTAQDPHDKNRRTEGIRAMAEWINAAEKFVFSKTRKSVTWHNSHLLPTFDPQAVRALKERPGKDLMLFGSASLVSQLSEHGLIDEYQFVVSPVLLGSGRPLLGQVPLRRKLKLLEAKPYPSGVVMLRYSKAD
jgi:dihydrofolate reductase